MQNKLYTVQFFFTKWQPIHSQSLSSNGRT